MWDTLLHAGSSVSAWPRVVACVAAHGGLPSTSSALPLHTTATALQEAPNVAVVVCSVHAGLGHYRSALRKMGVTQEAIAKRLFFIQPTADADVEEDAGGAVPTTASPEGGRKVVPNVNLGAHLLPHELACIPVAALLRLLQDAVHAAAAAATLWPSASATPAPGAAVGPANPYVPVLAADTARSSSSASSPVTAASSSVAPSAPPIVVVVLDDGSALLDACATSRDALYLVRGMAAMGTYTSAQGLGLVVASGGGGSGSGSSTLHTSMSVADVRLAAGFGTMSLHTVASSPALDVAAATGVVEGATARAPSSGGTTRRSSLTASDSTSKLGASVRSVVATVRVFMRFVADADMAVQGSLIADCTPEARVANAPEYATVSYVKYAASLADALVRVAPLPSGYSKDVAGRMTLTLRAPLAQSPVSDVRLHSVSMLSAVQREAAPWVPPASRSILFRIADNKIRSVGEPTLGSAPTTTSAAWSATLAKGG